MSHDWGVWIDGRLLRPFLTEEGAERFKTGLHVDVEKNAVVEKIRWVKDETYTAGIRPERMTKAAVHMWCGKCRSFSATEFLPENYDPTCEDCGWIKSD